MHVTILELSLDGRPSYCTHTEDEVFAQNEDKFPDGVTEHFGYDRQDDIRTLVDWLGPAVVRHGTAAEDGRNMEWLEIDTHRLEPLFRPYFNEMREVAAKLAADMTLANFSSRNPKMSDAIYRIRQAYEFDGIYILEASGECTPISNWLRNIQDEDLPDVRRYYVRSTYDGDQ